MRSISRYSTSAPSCLPYFWLPQVDIRSSEQDGIATSAYDWQPATNRRVVSGRLQRIEYLLIDYLWEGYALEVNSEGVMNKVTSSRARIEGVLSIGDSTGA